jgi:hypothetical protein
MWPYWLLFFIPAYAAITSPADLRLAQHPSAIRRREVGLWLTCILLILMIGLRYEVGADWENYFAYLYGVEGLSLWDIAQMTDPGFQLLNWISLELGWGVVGVNALAATLFSLGLITFCRSLPRPWLALAIAVPYLVIVVGMGYTRQGIALGMAMLGLAGLRNKSVATFVVCVTIGATFHRTAVLLLPLAALASTRRRAWTLVWVVVVSVVAYRLLLEKAIDELYVNYVEAEYQSDGAMVRLLMNSVPACALLIWRKKFEAVGVAGIWRWFAIVSLVLQAILFVSPSSTAVDRIALYMLPLQIVVFSHWPDVMGRGRDVRGPVLFVLSYYAFVQFVWLVFATYSFAWQPYRFYPTINL